MKSKTINKTLQTLSKKILSVKDVNLSFAKYLLMQNEKNIADLQSKIYILQKKYKLSDSEQFIKKFINKKDHDWETEEVGMRWASLETTLKNRYKDLLTIKRIIDEHSR